SAYLVQCPILVTIVNDNDMQIRIIRIEHGAYRALNHHFFVECGNQGRDVGFVRRRLARPAIPALPQTVEYSERADKKQAAGHQHVAYQENPVDASPTRLKQLETNQVEPGRPALVRRDRWH